MISAIIDLPLPPFVGPLRPPRRSASARVHVYRSNERKDLKGQHCKVLVRTDKVCLVQFSDGTKTITRRTALKRWQLEPGDRERLVTARQKLLHLRGSSNPSAQAAKVIIQGFDEALQTPGALAEVKAIMPANIKRFQQPTLDAFSNPPMSPEEIYAALLAEPDISAR